MKVYLQIFQTVKSLKQKPWLKRYRDENAEIRANARTDFGNQLRENLSTISYGKAMDDVRRGKEKNCNRKKRKFESSLYLAFVARKSMILMKATHFLFLNTIKEIFSSGTPVTVGFTVLELSKLQMYENYYDVLQPDYAEFISY